VETLFRVESVVLDRRGNSVKCRVSASTYMDYRFNISVASSNGVNRLTGSMFYEAQPEPFSCVIRCVWPIYFPS
jgi:hypothetical protein